MCSASVLCPLCAQSSFASIDALRVSLIRAANGPLPCPICHELFLGLDKLTIHLFSHTDIFAIATQSTVTNSNSVAVASDEKSPNIASSLRDMSATVTKLPSDLVRSKEIQELDTSKSQQRSSGCCEEIHVDEAIATVKKESRQNLPACDICELNFRNKELLELHFRLVHKNDASTSGDTSRSVNTSVDLGSGHGKMHEFKCHLCAKTFKMKGSLRVHLKVVHLIGLPVANNASKPSICDRIRSHKEEATIGQNNPTLQINAPKLFHFAEDPSQAHLNLQSKLNSCECKVSSSATSNMLMLPDPPKELPSNVVVTLRNDSNAEQPQLELEIDKDCVSKANAENAKIWECDVCSKAFTTKYFLKKHKRLHTGEMPYTCEICARTFTFQQSYHKHLLYHSDEKPHICVTCGRAFKELSTLHNHERIHSGEKPFKCDVCDKSFRQRVSFLVHTRIHTGVMPYKCDVCLKSFRYKVSQRTHKCLPHTVEEAVALVGDNNTETSEHISECFIKAFLESTTPTAVHESQNSPHSAEIAAINAMDINDGQMDVKHVMDEAMLSKTIDDIVVESCNKMGIDNIDSVLNLASNSNDLSGVEVCATDGHNSPSLKFQNMRLYSPVMLQQHAASTVNDATSDFSHFLLDDARNDIM